MQKSSKEDPDEPKIVPTTEDSARAAAMRRAQELVARWTAGNKRSLVDELIAERRAEASEPD